MPTLSLLNGFKYGETGYGFNEDGLYSYTCNEDTWTMNGLFKTKREAILNEIKETEDYLLELRGMLND